MDQTPKQRSSGPPHNPRLRDLVEGKRRWMGLKDAESAKMGFRGWHERGYLPHRDEHGLTQFVTFHLSDVFPSAIRSEWEHNARIEANLQQRKEIEAYLDRGRGDCHLARPEIAGLVEDNLRKFSGERYELCAWVVMPNHVHVLFKAGTVSMSDTVGAWKRNTGKLANRLLGKTGSFWAEDYFDVFMRDKEHERRTTRYIEQNPMKAKLVSNPKDWPWSSARFRDESGVLLVPECS